jgi:hypothetical protein
VKEEGVDRTLPSPFGFLVEIAVMEPEKNQRNPADRACKQKLENQRQMLVTEITVPELYQSQENSD